MPAIIDKYKKFSVLMSVYKNDKPEFLYCAIKSVTLLQTLQPSEVILVIDGPISVELNNCIKMLMEEIPYIRPIRLLENKGLGNALYEGLLACSFEIVMRMDSDDISVPNRVEKQIRYMEMHPDVSVLGGQISEFIDTEDNVVGYRVVPQTPEEIAHVIKWRCPFNHMSVAFLRSCVMNSGNYQDWFWNEDYYLWIRMFLAECKFANLPNILVNVRVGKDMYARRGGMRYFKSEVRLQKYMLDNSIINSKVFLVNVLVRFMVQLLLPNKVRGWFFQKFARS